MVNSQAATLQSLHHPPFGPMTANELSHPVIGKAIEVHGNPGPGLFERIYERALIYELRSIGLDIKDRVELPVVDKGEGLDIGYRMDLLAENKLIVEVKAVSALDEIDMSQIMTYLRLTGCSLGLLLNFNQVPLKKGIQRVAMGDPDI
jgi:GxxExxY protein